MILNSPYISGSLTVTGNEVVTGSLTVLGGITGTITGSATSASYAFNASYLNNSGSGEFVPTGSFNAFSSSILSYTASNNTNIGNIHSTTASLNTFSGSTNSRLSSIESTTASLNAASGSAITRLNALEVTSGSNITRISALEAASGSAITRLNALEVTSGSNISRLSSLESKTGSYATTGSNTFVDAQYISQSSNPTGFTTTASLYTDGGLRVAKDAYISGTLYLNNVTVYGTQSVCFITSSQLNISSNIISVNTATPSVRFGGLAVYDSGSTGLTGSILWDSQDNQWIYSNPSGSEYDSAMFLVGPRNSGVLGNEVGITCNFLSKGNGMHHMTSSGIFEDGSRTCFYGNASITSTGAACFGGATIIAGCVGIGYATPTVQLQVSGTIATGDSTNGWGRLSFNTNEVRLQASKDGIDPINISFWTQASGGAFAERMRIACDGKVGIGTTSPSAELQVNKNCDAVIAISNCVNVTSGNRGSIAFYNCAISTVGLIRAAAVTDNVGTELQFYTRPAGGSLTQVLTLGNTGAAVFSNALQVAGQQSASNYGGTGLNFDFTSGNVGRIASVKTTSGGSSLEVHTYNTSGADVTALTINSNGIASFACQICASSLSICGNAVLSRTSTSAGANVEFRTAGTLNWYLGTRGLVNNNFYIVNEGLSGLSNVIIDATTGATTFACQISTPTIIANNSSGFAACITSCSTDYSMYVRNMSSGFPLSIYTNGDSNGVNDDLKALKIARASNDNQFLAVSLIYGGFGYGYKFAPRYYNGAAYVCGAPTVIDSYGNIGINCIAPFMPLTVKGCAGIDKLVVNGTCFNSFGEHLQINGCARLFYGQFRVSSGPNDSNYMFLTHDDVNGYLCINRTIYAGNMILAPFGGVGINTSVVSSKLTVNSGINTSSANVLTLQQATNGANKDAAAFGLSIQNGGESTNAADLYISTASGGSLGERMRIMSTTPFVYITGTAGNISADTGNGNLLELYGSNITGACCGVGIGFTRAGSQLGYIKAARENASDEASYMIFATQTSAGTHPERMRITSGGTVGINNSSPDTNSRLDVNGQAFVARLAVYNDNGTPSLGTSPTLYSPASATLGISMGTAERVRISTSGTCFSCLVYAPSYCQPSGFTVYSFPINYGVSFCDVSSGNYLSVGGTEPGTINSYCAYAHGGISPRAVAANTEGMSWTCLRFVLRVLSPVGDTAGTPTYLQTAGYFYSTGWYGLGTCTNIAGVMDGSRGYSTVVLPWIPYSSFQNAGDVTGFGIRNVGPTTTRIGSVFIQYK